MNSLLQELDAKTGKSIMTFGAAKGMLTCALVLMAAIRLL
jgi:hypothetical protein